MKKTDKKFELWFPLESPRFNSILASEHDKKSSTFSLVLILNFLLIYMFKILLMLIPFWVKVRAEFISASGKVTHTSRQPCMLRFKSPHIRIIETLIKSSTLLAGYSSESQILSIKMSGFVEGIEPTVCVRVILEQRAEYRPGAGIPEIYSASLKLESQLPLLKRILWNWRRTVFIWVGMTLFFFELLIVLVCCRPVIIPRTRPSSETPSRT